MTVEELIDLLLRENTQISVEGAMRLRQQGKWIAQLESRVEDLQDELYLYKNKYKYNELVKFVQDTVKKQIEEENINLWHKAHGGKTWK